MLFPGLFLPEITGSLTGIGFEEGIEGRFGVEAGVKGYCENCIVLVPGVFYAADDFTDPVFINEGEEVPAVLLVKDFGYVMSGYPGAL